MPSGICVCILIVYKKESDIFLQSAITISKSYGNTEFIKEKGRGQPYDLHDQGTVLCSTLKHYSQTLSKYHPLLASRRWYRKGVTICPHPFADATGDGVPGMIELTLREWAFFA